MVVAVGEAKLSVKQLFRLSGFESCTTHMEKTNVHVNLSESLSCDGRSFPDFCGVCRLRFLCFSNKELDIDVKLLSNALENYMFGTIHTHKALVNMARKKISKLRQ